jgi:hypothetical protein
MMDRIRRPHLFRSITGLVWIGSLVMVQAAAGQVVVPNCEIRVADSGRLDNASSSEANLTATGSDGQLRLGRNVFFEDDTSVSGALVGLGNGASVFDVSTNLLKRGRGAVVRGSTTAFQGAGGTCQLPPVTCGGQSVTLRRGDAPRVLSPGTYDLVSLENGTSLSLAPGVYNFCSIKTGRHVAITVTGGSQSTINVSGDVRLGNDTTFGPAAGTPTPLLNVAGGSVHIGAQSTVRAFITAPNAKLALGRGATLIGAACARSLV